MERFAKEVIRLRWLIIVIVAALTVYFGLQIRDLTINSDVINSLNDNDPTARLYKEIGDEFGGNDMGMIVLETDDIFTAEVIRHIKQVTDSLKYTKGVSTVTSLTDIMDIKSSEWGIEIGQLVDEYNLPTEQADLDTLKKYIMSKDMYQGVIVSEDATAAVIVFNLLPEADNQAVANEIRSMISGLDLPEKVYYGGLPFILNDVTDLITSDITRLLPFAFLIIALFLYISLRSVKGVVLPLLIAGISVIWTLGLMSVLGYDLTITSSYMPVVLLAVGSAYVIHVVNSYELNKSVDRKQALISALTYTTIPILLASLTTMVGFVSFVVGSYLSMIRQFGIFTAAGTAIALLLSLFAAPALISVFSKNRKEPKPESVKKRRIPRNLMLNSLYKLIARHPRRIIIVWGILLLVNIGGIFLVKTSVNITNYFKENNPTRVTENLMQDKFGGSLPVYVVYEGDIQSPEVLRAMIHTEEFLKEDPNISFAQSIADLVEQMNNAMGEGMSIPDDRAKIEQLWFLLDGQDVLSQLVTTDLDKAVIQSKFASIETKDIEAFTKKMNQYIADNSGADFSISFTGIPSIYHKLNASLIRSQYSSLIIAIALVLVIVGLLLKSLLKGVFATIPIVATIFILLGFMGLTGIPLDIATVLVASIALGIGIDYSIHMITGFNSHLNGGDNSEEALEKTILTSGKAVITNAASVAGGFLILVLCQMVPFQHFGLLIAISMFGSGVGALTLLPALLILNHRRHNKIPTTN